MQIKKKSPLVAFAVVGALSIAACGSDSGSSDADPCDAAQKVSDAVDAGENAQSAEEIVEALDVFADALDDFAKAAPDEIKADAELLASGSRTLAEVGPDAEPSDEALEILEGDEFDEAGDRLDDYLEEACGLEF